jgi:hypothetical protein
MWGEELKFKIINPIRFLVGMSSLNSELSYGRQALEDK